MPITKSALKALRRDKRKTAINRPIKSRIKSSLDQVTESKAAKDLSIAFSAIDKALKRHLIHRNKAARLKSKASKIVSK
jgi:small subunit ribosomal protein S20